MEQKQAIPKSSFIKPFNVIVCNTPEGGIGKNGTLPWYISQDMEHFYCTTTFNVSPDKINCVIMGRRTWDSLPSSSQPLVNRFNCIISYIPSTQSDSDSDNQCYAYFSSLNEALKLCSSQDFLGEIFVIGGAEIYKQALQHPQCQKIYQTVATPKQDQDWSCDTFFPQIPFKYHTTVLNQLSTPAYDLEFRLLTRMEDQPSNEEETAYLRIVRDIIDTGAARPDRTGTGTKSKFGYTMRFNLQDGRFPLLTTKSVHFKSVAEELFWFIRGSTNAKELSAKGVQIWDQNASRSYLDQLGFNNREDGDLGPIYGHNWRHFGAPYIDMHTDYKGQGVDQLAEVIRLIKERPHDRRILMTSWNPVELKNVSLPACHVLCQFYVSDGRLSCQMYQRSADMGLGVPFNIASYALLTIMLAHVCNLQPGEYIHVLGDAHVYMNHIEPLKEQLKRTPRDFPQLRVVRPVSNIEDFKLEDFEIVGYQPYPKIQMKMAV